MTMLAPTLLDVATMLVIEPAGAFKVDNVAFNGTNMFTMDLTSIKVGEVNKLKYSQHKEKYVSGESPASEATVRIVQ